MQETQSWTAIFKVIWAFTSPSRTLFIPVYVRQIRPAEDTKITIEDLKPQSWQAHSLTEGRLGRKNCWKIIKEDAYYWSGLGRKSPGPDGKEEELLLELPDVWRFRRMCNLHGGRAERSTRAKELVKVPSILHIAKLDSVS